VNGLEILFHGKDKLYLHKIVIDAEGMDSDRRLMIHPWFKGFC